MAEPDGPGANCISFLTPRSGELVASVLTGNDLDDAGQVPVLLEQVDAEIASVTADGAYDGEPV